jgi:hypothetical protein
MQSEETERILDFLAEQGRAKMRFASFDDEMRVN